MNIVIGEVAMSGFTYSRPLIGLDAVVIDTETTGLDASKARVVQVGCVLVTCGRVAPGQTFDRLVNPGISIPPRSTAIHGISTQAVAQAPHFDALAPELERFIDGRLLVGHTIRYDLQVLRREYVECGRVWPAWRALDVRTLARLALPTLADHGLDRICEALDIEIEGRHSALGDARATAEVFCALIPKLRAKGIRTLAEADLAAQSLAEADSRAAGGLMQLDERGRPEEASLSGPRLDSYPYRHRVRDIMSAPPLFVEDGSSLAHVVATLLERRTSSVLIDTKDRGTAILTERDVLRALARDGEGALDRSASQYASAPLQTVAADAFVYRAIGRIERLGIRHLGVRGHDGAIVGVVTTRNLLRNRSTTALAIGDEIEAAEDAAALANLWSKAAGMARELVAEQIEAWTICAILSSEIRNMTRRAAQLAERKLNDCGYGPPPAPYAVLVLGSAGRGESLLSPDQDNAIIYADPDGDRPIDPWFERLAAEMTAILDAAGIPYCKGGVMASNRSWRMSAAEWRTTIDSWVRRQRPDDLLNVDIFFDAQPVHGAFELAQSIWEHAYEVASAAPDFMKLLTELARKRASPFTVFGNFHLDAAGRIDIKKYGLMPIFTSARVVSIRHDLRLRGTADRLRAAAQKGVVSVEIAEQVISAQGDLLAAALSQQIADIEAGLSPTPRVAPQRLTAAERKRLKAALTLVDEAVGFASEGLF